MPPQEPAWKKKCSFLTPNYEESTVGDETIHFYPVSVGLAFKLRRIAGPLAAALATLFARRDKDAGHVERAVPEDIRRKDGEPTLSTEIIDEATAVPMAQLRHSQQITAIEKLIDALTDPDNLAIVGEIVMDSLREIFPRGEKDNPPPAEFMNTLPLPRLTDMLIGVGKANKDVLGPLTGKLSGLLGRMEAALRAKLQTPENEPEGASKTPAEGSTPG